MNIIRYCSTRGKASLVTSAEAIKTGLAPDNGLYVPAEKITPFSTGGLPSGSYHDLAVTIFSLFLSDYSSTEIENAVRSAYNASNFDHPLITPLHKLSENNFVMELWHGPTYAFKDIALQILPHLLQKAIEKTGEKAEMVILTATSGDTGKSALEGFRDVPGIQIVVYYPENGVSEVQKMQMTTQDGSNVNVAAVRGNFDDTQTGVKNIFNDLQLADQLSAAGYCLSSANSINWGRLLPQIVYYFTAYDYLARQNEIQAGDKINFVVPTGNFGNILAGYYANQLGLPINRLICATNRNNVLYDFINSGRYNGCRQLYLTSSPSMDILISSNLERLLYTLNGNDSELLSSWMRELQDRGEYRVDRTTFGKIENLFWSDYANEKETLQTIADTYQNFNYLIDPHTAVGKAVLDKYLHLDKNNCPAVILSTANPFKFTGTVMKALEKDNHFNKISELDLLETLAEMTGLNVPANLAVLKDRTIRHKDLISPEIMSDHLISLLGLN